MDIVLSTLNAKFIHASLGLRYLRANLGELRARTVMEEFTIHDRPADLAERLLAHSPKIIGLGVYVWNAQQTHELVQVIKKVAPHVVVVLGGPEVRYEQKDQPLCALADYVVAGEADHAFRELCTQILSGAPPKKGVLFIEPPALGTVALPFDEYTDKDLAERVLYVEASRGCPYKCEFCLSSMDEGVRRFETDAFLRALEKLIGRGARQFKFVDRTFNLDLKVTAQILEFFLARAADGVFAHFELVPDRLPEALRELISRFPDGALQFEVGIQTWDPPTAARISRRQDYSKTEENLTFLKSRTGVHLHTDLIVGLPGEDIATFAAGFDRLVNLEPHEIQVGILKRLRGTPIIRHDAEWGMVYGEKPPYEILRTKVMGFETLQHLKRFARAWDLVANSGRYPALRAALLASQPSPFEAFSRWTSWLHGEVGDFTGLNPERLATLLGQYLVSTGLSADAVRQLENSDGDARARARLKQRAEAKALRRQAAHAEFLGPST